VLYKEQLMKLVVTSRPEAVEFQFAAKWRLERKTIEVTVKAAKAAVTTSIGAYGLTELHRLGTLLGWW